VDRTPGIAGDAHWAATDFAARTLRAADRSPADLSVVAGAMSAGAISAVIAVAVAGGVATSAVIAVAVGVATEADGTAEAGLGASALGGTIRGVTGAVTTPVITITGIMATPITGMIRTLMHRRDTMEEAWSRLLADARTSAVPCVAFMRRRE
jgi:hypothetical protein